MPSRIQVVRAGAEWDGNVGLHSLFPDTAIRLSRWDRRQTKRNQDCVWSSQMKPDRRMVRRESGIRRSTKRRQTPIGYLISRAQARQPRRSLGEGQGIAAG